MKIFKIILAFIILTLTLNANTKPEKRFFSKNFYLYDTEFKKVAKIYDLPFILLKAVALTENHRFNANKKRDNKNKTKDYGLMQINTIWLKEEGLSEKEILKPVKNIEIGAKILKGLIKRNGYSWNTIGKYHSSTPEFKKIWLERIQENMRLLIQFDKKYKYVVKN